MYLSSSMIIKSIIRMADERQQWLDDIMSPFESSTPKVSPIFVGCLYLNHLWSKIIVQFGNNRASRSRDISISPALERNDDERAT